MWKFYTFTKNYLKLKTKFDKNKFSETLSAAWKSLLYVKCVFHGHTESLNGMSRQDTQMVCPDRTHKWYVQTGHTNGMSR